MTFDFASGVDYEAMFELAPVSLWLEDYSALLQLFTRWRAAGVSDVRAFLQQQPERVQECSAAYRVLQVNRRTLELFAAPDQATLIARLGEVFRGDMHQRVIDELVQLWEGGRGFSTQTVNYALDGRRLDVRVQARILPGHEADWSRVLVSLEDVTAEVQATARLHASQRYACDLFEYSPVSLWVEDFSQVKQLLSEVRAIGITDFATFLKVHPEFVTRCIQEIRVIDVNRQTLTLFGAASKGELLSSTAKIFRGEMRHSFAEQLQDLWDGKLVQQREVINYALSGDALNIHMQFCVLDSQAQDWSLVLLSLIDITARKKAESYLEYLGKHDVLTQLRNRAYYMEELNRLARKGPWPVAVLAMDMNSLKEANDEHGHAAGDAMLRRVGEVLAKAVDAPACAARIGGDEFMVLLPATDERGALAAQERIRSLLELNNQFYPGQAVSLSMGLACCHEGEAMEAVVQRADQAMYAAKSRYYEDKELDRRRLYGAGVASNLGPVVVQVHPGQ